MTAPEGSPKGSPRAPQGEHTPVPWRRDAFYSFVGANGKGICWYTIDDDGVHCRDEDVDTILRAVNSHAALVAALEACLESFWTIADSAGDVAEWNEGGQHYEACKQARAALAAVEGEGK